MMFILDSGVFIPRFRLDTPAMRTLLFDRDRKAYSVGVPRVVLLEVKNKFGELAAKALEPLQGLGLSFYPDQPAADIVASETEQFGMWLDEQLARAEVQILETPAIPHDQIVSRALKRRRPFDDKGHNGYRDVLIWETVLATAANEQVVFVSRNSRDFEDKGKLHAHLVEDAKAAGYADERILYYGSLSTAVETHIEEAWADVSDRWPEFSEAAEHDAKELLHHHLANRAYSPRELGLPPTIENASVVDVKMAKVELRAFRRSPAGEFHALLEVVAELHIDAVMPESPVLTIPSTMGGGFDDVRAVADISAKISLVLDEKDNTPSSYEIVFGPSGRATLR